MFAFVALVVPGAESTQAASFVFAFPLTFISSVFVPTQTYTIEWPALLARNSPITAAADATRALAVTGPMGEPLLRTAAWTIALLVIFIPLSIARSRRIEWARGGSGRQTSELVAEEGRRCDRMAFRCPAGRTAAAPASTG